MFRKKLLLPIFRVNYALLVRRTDKMASSTRVQTVSKRKEILIQAGLYAFSSQLTQLITLIAAILSRRFLGPAQVGVWATLQVIVEYSKYSTLGTLYSVAREIPYMVGKGQNKLADEIKNVVFTVVLSGSFLIAAGIILFAILTKGRFAPEMTYGLFFVSGIIILQRINDLMISLLRCYKKFTIASSQMVWSAIVNAFLVAFLTYFFKIYGFIWAMGLSFIFNVLYIHWRNNFHFRLKFDPKRFKALTLFGFPLMLIGIITTVLRSMDKIFIAKLLGFEALGFYSIAFMVLSYIGNFSNSVAIVLVPHLQERFAANDNPHDLSEFLYKAAHAFALTTPAMIGAAWIIAPYFIALLLPKFTPGIGAMKILSLSLFFLSLTQPYSDFLITIKKHLFLFPLLTLSTTVTVILNYYVIHAGFGITGVAWAMSFAAFFNFSTTYFLAARYLDEAREALRKYMVLMSNAVYLLLVLFLINHWIPADIHSIPKAVIQFLIFLTCYGPLLILFNHKLKLIPINFKKQNPINVDLESNEF